MSRSKLSSLPSLGDAMSLPPCQWDRGGRSAASRRQKGERSSPDPSDLLDRRNAAPERPPSHDHDEATQQDQRRRTCCAEVVAVAGESDVVPTICSLVFRAFAPGPALDPFA